jgi:hypothetical protein
VRLLRRWCLVCALALIPALAGAQDFGVMGSAETINRGNFKVMANPLLVFQDGEIDKEIGISGLLGYGFTPRLDGEVKVALFDNVSYVGGDVEYWILRNRGLDFSAIGGIHFGWGDEGIVDTSGIDLTFQGSGSVTSRLEIYGALDFAFNSLDIDGRFEFDNDYTTVHLVPGLEYALSNDVDVVGELGIGLNDDSSNYISAGIAYYLR